MAVDATGTPTSPDSIPTYTTAADAPSGKGFNAAMAAIQAALSKRPGPTITSLATNDVPVWNGTTWVRPSGTGSATTFLRGDGSWAAAGAITQIYDSTLGASALSFDVTGISGSYNHLQIIGDLRTDFAGSTDSVLIRFNNDSGANYDIERLEGTNAGASAGVGAGGTSLLAGACPAATAAANTFGYQTYLLPSYAGTTRFKTIDGRSSGVGTSIGFLRVTAGLWHSTAAITRITILPQNGPNFVTGSRISIYGII